MSDTVSISEAAEVLQVTEKTIRNYIKRGFLNPQKWNGMWQIPRNEILEISEKKNIKIEKCSEQNWGSEIGVSKGEYSEQMIGLGKLQAYEALLTDQKNELSRLQERIIQLEASSAAGWTEARAAQAECKSLRENVEKLQSAEGKAQEELAWLRREKDRLTDVLAEHVATNRKLLRRMRELEDRLHMESIVG